MSHDAILAGLPIEQRLALAYSPASTRVAMLGVLALDARLGGIVRGAREPLLAQLRLAWWREQVGKGSGERAKGDPLLALLDAHNTRIPALSRLMDGWEGLLGEGPLLPDAIEELAEARALALSGLAPAGQEAEAERAARNWALIDIAARLGDQSERECAREIALRQDWRRPALTRALRPLVVLHGLARRSLDRGCLPLLSGIGALPLAIRLGTLGF